MDIDIQCAWIPPGQFLMGGSANDNEKPHRVSLSKGFWMGIHPVTQAQYEAVMGYNPSHFQGEDRPVENVSWDDAQEFCKKIRALTGRHARLPTEAEWEHACRAGTGGDYWCGNDEAALKKAAWYDANSGKQTHPVGKLAPNKWGLYDVLGNVWEWCEDAYEADSYKKLPANDPVCKGSGQTYRVLRGGSWNNHATYCRCASRDSSTPDLRNLGLGFRLVLSPPEDSK